MTSDSLPSRRSVVRAAAWALPVVFASVGVPSSSASTPPRGGVIHFNGAAGAWTDWDGAPKGEVVANGINWDGWGATGTYAVGTIAIVLTLPGEVSSASDLQGEWAVSYSKNVVTIVNAVPLSPDTVVSSGDSLTILGAFAAGSSFDVNVVPATVDVDGELGGGTHRFAAWG